MKEHAIENLTLSLNNNTFSDRYTAPLMGELPPDNDQVSPSEWRAAVGLDGLNTNHTVDGRSSRIYVGATRSHLCLAVVSEVHPQHGFLPGDAIEVLIGAAPSEDPGAVHCLRVNPVGGISHTLLRPGKKPLHRASHTRHDAIRITSARHENAWHCQIVIPSALFGRPLTTSEVWAINIHRLFHQPSVRASLTREPSDQNTMATFRFTETPEVAVQCQHDGNAFEGNIRLYLSLFNPSPSPADVNVGLLCRLPRRPDVCNQVPLHLAGGEQRTIMLKIEALAALSFDLVTFATDAEGSPLYARHNAYLRTQAPRWTPPPMTPLPVDFKFAYYPSYNLLRVKADITGLPKTARLTHLHFCVRPKAGGPAILEFTLKARHFSKRFCEIEKTLPPLVGEFEISATAEGSHVPTEPLIKTFERHRFDWEQKGLGTSRKVFPPFTPIEVNGNTLRTVLKTYALNPAGLLDSILTGHSERPGETEELLASPMRYATTVNGHAVSTQQPAVTFESVAEDRVVAHSQFSLGAITAKSTLTLDYDGTLRVDLTLPPSPGSTLDSLDLEIPLRGRMAQMVHASNGRFRDAIEFRRLPEEQGVVWSSANIPPTGWEKNFCSYVFLGNANRGLCWFTDNSGGWSRDLETPNMEVTRHGAEVTLRIHFVNKPVAMASARTITFGLLAAPVKPRLQGWRHRWYTESFSVLGCDCHWLSLGNYACFYPPGKEMAIWNAIDLGNQEHLSDQEINEIIRDNRRHVEPYGEVAVRLFENMANLNLRNRFGTKMIYYYNRDVTVDSEECRTFIDEWGMDDFNAQRDLSFDPQKPSRLAMGIVPTASHIDFILYWYGRSFDIGGNLGVYMDNLYFRPFRNRVTTGAYQDDDRATVPSNGIWELREQARRTFTFLNERGMEPIHMGHMTSLACLPILSFYTIQYDWEWQRGHKDVHDRFTREYLQLVSSGELAGTWPIVLHELGEQEEGMVGRYPYPELRRRMDEAAARSENPWVLRTFLGVTLVHELLVDPYRWHYEPVPPGDTAENRLFETFRRPILNLVQHPDTEVFRYWDARPQPVTTGNADLPVIVFSRKGTETLVVITNYADTDQTTHVLMDTAALGVDKGCRIVDIETGLEIPMTNNQLSLTVKKHDLRELRILPC